MSVREVKIYRFNCDNPYCHRHFDAKAVDTPSAWLSAPPGWTIDTTYSAMVTSPGFIKCPDCQDCPASARYRKPWPPSRTRITGGDPCPQCKRGPMTLVRRGAQPVREILECQSCGWPTQVYCGIGGGDE